MEEHKNTLKHSNLFTKNWLIGLKIDKVFNAHNGKYGKDLIRRVAYDNVVGDKWRRVYEPPFIKNATDEHVDELNNLLISYVDERIFLNHKAVSDNLN